VCVFFEVVVAGEERFGTGTKKRRFVFYQLGMMTVVLGEEKKENKK
jgi:hypothetical protein